MAARREDPAYHCDLVYAAAEAVQAAYKAVNLIPFDKRPALDTLLNGKIYPGDLDALAKQLKAHADQWQDELDAVDA